MKFRRAYLSDSVNAKLTHLCTVADRSFRTTCAFLSRLPQTL